MNSKVRIVYGLPIALAIFVTCLWSVTCFAGEPAVKGTDSGMEVVWAESDGIRHEIYSSSFLQGAWTEPQKITDDNADNIHPTIDVGPDGRKWVAWTAIELSGFEIRFSVYEKGAWREAQNITDDFSSALKPSIIVDKKNIPLVVFSANNGDNDEIYYARYQNGEWSKAKRVHSENEVPDILPFLDTDADGNPILTWQSYTGDGYGTLQSIWEEEKGWSTPVEIEPADVDAEGTVIALPEFIKDTPQVFLRVY